MGRRIKKEVLALCLLSVFIYGLQLLIFRDPKNTFFYIFQDFAFLPLSIAIATVIVGALMDERDKRERVEKTRMLTSSFFTEIGARLTMSILKIAEPKETISSIIAMRCSTEMDLKDRQNLIREMPIKIHLNEEIYEESRNMILGSRTALLVLASNPLLLEHEEFTDLLWALFHLIDEYRLREEFDQFSPEDLHHIEQDYTEVMKLLLVNYLANAKYLQEVYPNLYMTAARKIREAVED